MCQVYIYYCVLSDIHNIYIPMQCPSGMIGNGKQCISDSDYDGVPDTELTTGCSSIYKCNKVNNDSIIVCNVLINVFHG